MKKLFKRIVAWFEANRQYHGFTRFLVFSAGTAALAICDIHAPSPAVKWLIVCLWLVSALNYASMWIADKNNKSVIRLIVDSYDNQISDLTNERDTYHANLIAANRRRKRAEKKLKKQRQMYRDALDLNVELRHRLIKTYINNC